MRPHLVRSQGAAVNALTPVAERLGKLVRLMASDVDGEALAALTALRRTLATVGADLNDLADVIEKGGSNGNGSTLSSDDMKRIYDAGYQDGLRKAEATQHVNSNDGFANTDGTLTWHQIAAFCTERAQFLEDKNAAFVRDMAGKTLYREPTERQSDWLKSLFFRLGGKPRQVPAE
jgi:hypothetical protein